MPTLETSSIQCGLSAERPVWQLSTQDNVRYLGHTNNTYFGIIWTPLKAPVNFFLHVLVESTALYISSMYHHSPIAIVV